jgi:VWFA-related protein
MKTTLSRLLPLLILFATAKALTRSPSPQDPADEPIRLRTELVTIDAQVTRKKTGEVVGGLSQDDFTSYEDGIKQQITYFSQDKLPLSIVLLLDVSASVQPIINQVRDEGMLALRQLRPDDEVAVMAFGKWATVKQDFTKDRQLVIKRIQEIEWMGNWIREATHIDEAVYQAATYSGKATNPDSRRVIIIITDNQSNQPPALDHSESEALAQLMEAGGSLSGLIVGDFAAAASKYKQQGEILRDSIASYVSETGGIVQPIEKSDAVEKLARLIERLRSRYSFGYTSQNAKQDGKFRKIKLAIAPRVENREGGIAIVTRKGYYARPHDGETKTPTPKPPTRQEK